MDSTKPSVIARSSIYYMYRKYHDRFSGVGACQRGVLNHTMHLLMRSFNTMSEISNSFTGRGIPLLAAIVFSNPDNSVVLATYKQNNNAQVAPVGLVQDSGIFFEPEIPEFWDC